LRKIGRGVSPRETTRCGCPLRGHGFVTPHRSFAVPSRLRRAGSPTAKPRRLSPFGSISPAAKPRWPVIGPTFWVCRAKSGAAFRRAKRPGAVCPLRGHGFATPHRSFAVPVTAAPRRVPNGKTPALAPVRLHFARGETARPLFPHFCPARL